MSKRKCFKFLLEFVMCLAFVVGIFVNPKTTMKVEAYIEETYTPADGDVDNGLVKIDTTAKTIWVQHESEHEPRNLYTFSGYSGYSVTVVSAYNLNVTLDKGTYEVEFDTTYENPDEANGVICVGANANIKEVKPGVAVGESSGMIEVNNASIGTNYGIVLVNNNTIAVNYGSIANNTYFAGVDRNFGVITSQSGIVGSNQIPGRIENNTAAGWIDHNYGIVSVNSGEIVTNEPTGCVYENFGTIITENSVAYAARVYNETIEKTGSLLEELAQKLADGEQVEDATVYFTVGHSLPISLMKTLKNCPGVTLDFKCTYEGEKFHFAFKGGENLVINEDIPWYGPHYLKNVYGVAGDDTDAGQKETTVNSYVIQKGDTLYRISGKLGISLAEIIKKNPQIKDPNYIRAGQMLNY